MTYFLEGLELEQFNIVVACYKRAILGEKGVLPAQFQTDEVNSGYLGINWLGSRRRIAVLYRYSATSYLPHAWQLPVTIVPIRNAIQAICAYQTARQARLVGCGHLLDPTNLVCEQLKHWLARLASRDMSEGLSVKQEIGSYVEYLKSLNQARVFPATRVGLSHERTMSGTLVEVCADLQSVTIEIEDLMQRQSLRDVMLAISKSTANAMNTLIQHLFYVLRNHKTPAAVSIRDIQDHCRIDLSKARRTRSFGLLIQLVKSPYVRAVNFDQSFELYEAQFIFANQPLLHIKKDWHPERLFDSDSARRTHQLNQQIGGHLIPDRHTFRRWWHNIHSGISGHFQLDQTSLERFVKLHSLVEKLALFCLICRDLEELVDFFGAKIWADLGRQVLHNFQEGFRLLCMDLRGTLQQLNDVASRHYQFLSQRGYSHKPWLQNFNTADRLKTTLCGELEYGLEKMGQINGLMHVLNSPEKAQRIRQKLTGVVHSLNQFGTFFKLTPITLGESEVKVVSAKKSLFLQS